MQTSPTPTPTRVRRAGALLAMIMLLAAGASAGYLLFGQDGGNDPRPATAPPAETNIEAEKMATDEGAADVEDGSAGAGGAVRFARESTASITVTTIAARGVVIRAKGDQCEGAPQAVLTVDGARVLAATVSSTTWQTYSGPASLSAGRHRIELSYPNNLSSDTCDRNLFVDRISFTGAAPSPTGQAPRPAPSQSNVPSRVIWRGDFEPGDLSQWDTKQRVADDRIRVVGSPTRQGNSAGRFEVREGDNVGDGAPRSELALLSRRDVCCREGDERWYRWQTMFAQDFPSHPDRFIDFMQFKKDGEGSGPVTFMVWGEQMELRANGTHWAAPLRRGQWEDFVFHVKWSPDPSVGFIELWHNGQRALPRKFMLTLDRDQNGNAIPAYLKQGLYRSDDFTETGILYHDGMVAGTTARSVGASG